MKLAPWLPPSCRGKVINTEFKKKSSKTGASDIPGGCPKTLAELIRKGVYDPLNIGSFSAVKLHEICSLVGISINGNTSKVAIIITRAYVTRREGPRRKAIHYACKCLCTVVTCTPD